MPATFDDLLRHMASDLPGCPPYEMLEELRNAWWEFCERTGIWRPKITRSLLPQRAHALTPPAAADIKKVLKVWIRTAADVAASLEGSVIHPARYDIVRTAGGVEVLLNFTPPEEITGGLVAHVVLSPVRGTKDCEAPEILNDYHDALVGRAVYKLATRPKRRWTSVSIAREAIIKWNNGLNSALRDTLTVRKGESACVRMG